MRRILSNEYLVALGQAKPETALATAYYPASGSFINVAAYPEVEVLIHLGTINASDTPIFTLYCSDATNGTPDAIDGTYAAHTSANDDDGELVTFHVETGKLPADHHFITCGVASAASTSYADILYLLKAESVPVTQTTAVLPTASQHEYDG